MQNLQFAQETVFISDTCQSLPRLICTISFHVISHELSAGVCLHKQVPTSSKITVACFDQVDLSSNAPTCFRHASTCFNQLDVSSNT